MAAIVKAFLAALISVSILFAAAMLILWRGGDRTPPAPAPADGVLDADALAGLAARLDRIEAAIARLPANGPGLAAGARPTGAPSPSAAPVPSPQPASAGERAGWEAALARLESRLDELRDAVRTGGLRGDMSTSLVVTSDPAPPELQVRLNAHLVDTAEGPGVKVYWTILSGAASASKQDWVALFQPGADNRTYRGWKYTGGAARGDVILPLPEAAGQYEIRYLFRSGYEAVPNSSPPLYLPGAQPATAAEAEATGRESAEK